MVVPDYELPEAAIAQVPVEPRDAARMLDVLDPGRPPVDRTVRDLPDLLRTGDVVVVNNSKVIPARLRLQKVTGGVAEVLLLEPDPGSPDHRRWTALVRPGRRLPPGTRLLDKRLRPVIEVGARTSEDGERAVMFLADPQEVLDRAGEVALPPYIDRPLADPGRYQTVYADRPGSVAAPTAGLHLTEAVLDRVKAMGVEVHAVDLAVGLATFRPVTTAHVDEHAMHTEAYRIPPSTWAAVGDADRVIAVGTTTVRALESAALTGRLEGRSDLFIRPGFRFQVVDVLLTNFHMPRSTLLLLLEAFTGPGWRDTYETAKARGYRFLSFGDCMLAARS